MTDIEQKAQALVDAVRSEYPLVSDFHATNIALFRAIEQHEAFRQEVSDAVELANDRVKSLAGNTAFIVNHMQCFIIPAPKPDPLEEIIGELDDGTWGETKAEYADRLRAALEARGLEIREKE